MSLKRAFDPDTRYALRIPAGGNVTHGTFWPDGLALGNCVWDAWLTNDNGGYFLSDGYGGAHSLLWGFSGANGPQYGNIWNGSGTQSFGGNYAPAPGEWVHIAVQLYGSKIFTYMNGICDSVNPFSGTRTAASWLGGAGVLFVGGSDHIQGSGSIGLIRGFDRDAAPLQARYPFSPSGIPSQWWDPSDDPALRAGADFFCDYTHPGFLLDQSPAGCEHIPGIRGFHHGRIWNPAVTGASEAGEIVAYLVGDTALPLPYWLADPACPVRRAKGQVPARDVAPAAPSAPSGCLVFDSFSRRNQTLAFSAAPSLGSTEAGSLGPLAWQVGGAPWQNPLGLGRFGILGGKAVVTNGGLLTAWVPVGTANQDIRLKRTTSGSLNAPTGIAFRVQDGLNFWQLNIYPRNELDTSDYWDLNLAYFTAGGGTYVTGAAIYPGNTFSHIRVVANGTTITCYTGDGISSWTQQIQVTNSYLQSAQGAGLTNAENYSGSINTTYRWDDLAVFAG